MSSLVYEDLWASCVKFCQTKIAEFISEGIASPSFLDFDTHATLVNLPDADLVGIRGFSVEAGQPLNVSVLFGVATKTDDTNLFRHRAMVARLFQDLMPTKKIDCVDATTGVVTGFLVAEEGTAVLPVTSAETRPLQFISVAFKTDQPGSS